jgi:hypothetical protein
MINLRTIRNERRVTDFKNDIMVIDLDKIFLYRMSHITNVPHILAHGITHRNSANANPDYTPIGDGSLIRTRDEKLIWVNNGETFSFDHEQIKLGDFTPFYFGKRMPMLYVIQKGYNGVKQVGASEIVYIGCSVQSIINAGLKFYFTDGHATDNLSSCYDQSMIGGINNIVDFATVGLRDWTSGRDLKRKKEAEFLIAGDIPVNCVIGFACYNDIAAKQLNEIGVDENLIHIKPNHYF